MESERPAQTTESERSPEIIAPGHTYASVTDKISTIVLTGRTPRGWWIGFGVAFALVMVLLYSVAYLLAVGTGIWGINVPVGWGFAIINFVWWIGIGHAGTLISAILLLLRQQWRTSIKPFRRSHDVVRGRLCGNFSAPSHGASVAVLLAHALPQHDGGVAAVPQPAGLGCLCG